MESVCCIDRRVHLKSMSCGVHAEAESLIEGWFSVMTANPCLFLDDPFLSSNIHHIQLHIQIYKPQTPQ